MSSLTVNTMKDKTTPCSNHERDNEEEEERKAEERMMIIIRNGNEGTHYPEYGDYLDDTDEE